MHCLWAYAGSHTRLSRNVVSWSASLSARIEPCFSFPLRMQALDSHSLSSFNPTQSLPWINPSILVLQCLFFTGYCGYLILKRSRFRVYLPQAPHIPQSSRGPVLHKVVVRLAALQHRPVWCKSNMQPMQPAVGVGYHHVVMFVKSLHFMIMIKRQICQNHQQLES